MEEKIRNLILIQNRITANLRALNNENNAKRFANNLYNKNKSRTYYFLIIVESVLSFRIIKFFLLSVIADLEINEILLTFISGVIGLLSSSFAVMGSTWLVTQNKDSKNKWMIYPSFILACFIPILNIFAHFYSKESELASIFSIASIINIFVAIMFIITSSEHDSDNSNEFDKNLTKKFENLSNSNIIKINASIERDYRTFVDTAMELRNEKNLPTRIKKLLIIEGLIDEELNEDDTNNESIKLWKERFHNDIIDKKTK